MPDRAMELGGRDKRDIAGADAVPADAGPGVQASNDDMYIIPGGDGHQRCLETAPELRKGDHTMGVEGRTETRAPSFCHSLAPGRNLDDDSWLRCFDRFPDAALYDKRRDALVACAVSGDAGQRSCGNRRHLVRIHVPEARLANIEATCGMFHMDNSS